MFSFSFVSKIIPNFPLEIAKVVIQSEAMNPVKTPRHIERSEISINQNTPKP